jgi:thiamine biosynthesis lipoprotein
VRVDARTGRLAVRPGVRLDLGATAKALCADRAAARAARAACVGVLVSLGGDIAVAGEVPEGGWRVRVTDRADSRPDGLEPGQTVTVRTGGMATSGTSARRWARAGATVHHLIDPRSGPPAAERWRTVTVAAPSCVAANVASTAAIILGDDAVAWLEEWGHDARLVAPSGEVTRTGAWPTELVEVVV